MGQDQGVVQDTVKCRVLGSGLVLGVLFEQCLQGPECSSEWDRGVSFSLEGLGCRFSRPSTVALVLVPVPSASWSLIPRGDEGPLTPIVVLGAPGVARDRTNGFYQ